VPAISLRYTGNPDPADDLATAAPVNGVINYPQHIQPLWTRARGVGGAQTCVRCHDGTAGNGKLDLRGTTGGAGRMTSYQELLTGDPVIDPATGLPVTVLRNGVPEVQRTSPLVETSSGAANTAGQARKSRLTEILWGQTLLAGAGARTDHPNPPAAAPNHALLLTRAEKRLLAEWMDLGGQYYNDPFDANGGVRVVTALSEASFVTQVQPVLQAQCAACHQAGAGNPGNRFVLTGDDERRLQRHAQPHQRHLQCRGQPAAGAAFHRAAPGRCHHADTAVLPVGSAGYTQIAAWISQGCSNP
jgi:hypothetical protein